MDANPGTGTALHAGTEKRLKDKHIFSHPRSFARTEKKFNRNTERMPFVITYTAWKYLFHEKVYKTKDEKLARVENNKER